MIGTNDHGGRRGAGLLLSALLVLAVAGVEHGAVHLVGENLRGLGAQDAFRPL